MIDYLYLLKEEQTLFAVDIYLLFPFFIQQINKLIITAFHKAVSQQTPHFKLSQPISEEFVYQQVRGLAQLGL